MIGKFTDNFGNAIEVEILNFKDGIIIPMTSNAPLVIDLKPLAGTIEFFPIAITKIAKMKFESVDIDYFEELFTESKTVTIKRNGDVFFTGKTTIFNNKEPLTSVPFEFEIEAFDELSEFNEKDYSDYVNQFDDTQDLKKISEFFSNFTVQNIASSLSDLKLRIRMLLGLTYLQVAEYVANILLASFYVSDKLYLHGHNYEGISVTRDLTDSALLVPEIYASPQAKRILVEVNIYRDNIFLIDALDTNPAVTKAITVSKEGFTYVFWSGFPTNLEINLKGIQYLFNYNSSYNTDFQNNNIEIVEIPKLILEVYVGWVNLAAVSPQKKYVFFDEIANSWVANNVGAEKTKTYFISPIAESEFNVTLNIPAYSGVEGGFGYKPFVKYRLYQETILDTVYDDDEFLYKPYDSVPFEVGGTISYSVSEISLKSSLGSISSGFPKLVFNENISISRVVNPTGVDYKTVVALSDYGWQTESAGGYRFELRPNLGVEGEAYRPSWANRIFKAESPFSASDFPIQNIDESLISKLVDKLSVLLSKKITLLDLDLLADFDLYSNPFLPFYFDYGKGEKLFKVLEGSIDVRANIFTGTIHEIIQE